MVITALFLADVSMPVAPQAQTRQETVNLRVFVHDTDRKPIRRVSIDVIGIAGSILTDDTGQGTARVPPAIGYGGKVKLQVSGQDSKRYGIVSPMDSEVVVARDYNNVMLFRKDQKPLQNRAVLEQIDIQSGNFSAPAYRDLVSKVFGATPDEIVTALGAFRNAKKSTEDKELATRLETVFRSSFESLSAKLDEVASLVGKALSQKTASPEEVAENQRLREEIQRLRAEHAQAQQGPSRSEREAELERQQVALMQQYEALLRQVNSQSASGRTNATYSSGSGTSAGSSGGGMSLLGAVGTLAGISGLVAGAAVLSKKLSPKADATFTMNPDCSSPCALISGVTTAQFSVTTHDTSNFDYKWNFGNGRTDFGTSVTHTFFDPGTFTVTLTAEPNKVDSGATGASGARAVTVRSLTGLWRFASGNSQGSFQLSQFGTSISGNFTIGTAQGSGSGTVSSPRTVRISVGFNGDSIDGTADTALNTISGNYRIASTGAIQTFTLTRVQ